MVDAVMWCRVTVPVRGAAQPRRVGTPRTVDGGGTRALQGGVHDLLRGQPAGKRDHLRATQLYTMNAAP